MHVDRRFTEQLLADWPGKVANTVRLVGVTRIELDMLAAVARRHPHPNPVDGEPYVIREFLTGRRVNAFLALGAMALALARAVLLN